MIPSTLSNSLGRGNPDFLRPKLELLKFDKSASYWTYDAFNPPAADQAQLIFCSAKDAWGQTGEVNITIEDAGNQLPAGVMNGNKFKLSISHNGVDWTPFLAGWIREKGTDRNETGIREIKMHGYGNKIRGSERLVNFLRIARRDVDGVTPDLTDPTMKCSELMKTAWTSADVYPFGDPETFTTGGVATVSETLASLRETFIQLGDIANRLQDASGGLLDIDANDVVVFDYLANLQSGVVIRDTVNLQTDPESKTGYFVGPWKFTDSIKVTEGFANRLIGIGGSDFHLDVDKWTDAGSDEFHSVDRAMQFTPAAPRLTAMALRLSKNGSPTNAITGEVRLNNEATNKPGEQVGSFTIIPADVGASVTDVNKINVQMTDNRLQVDKKYWIVLLKNGSAGHHFKWHHDAGASGTYATRAGGSWTTFTGAKTYAHRVFSSRRVLHEASDMISRARYGTIDKKVYAPFIFETRAMDTLLTGLLLYTARQRRKYEINRILAPTTILKSGRLVKLIDTLEGINSDAIVQSIGYTFDTRANGMGTRWADIQLTAFVP